MLGKIWKAIGIEIKPSRVLHFRGAGIGIERDPIPRFSIVMLAAGLRLPWAAEIDPSKSARGKEWPQRNQGSSVGKSWHLLHFVTQDSGAILTVGVGLG